MAPRFLFRGKIPASKSILNRLLILNSFDPLFEVGGESVADDVVKMKYALAAILSGDKDQHNMHGVTADCGAAGTTLRFLALRASRIPGTHHLTGTLRLFERPQDELVRLIAQLGCTAELGPQRLTIRGAGWSFGEHGVEIDRSVSSQFASALLLSAWDLPMDLHIRFAGELVSDSYFTMTKELVRRAGMKFVEPSPRELIVRAFSRIQPQQVQAESDLSSAFAVAALAVAVGGSAEILDWPSQSLQPDRVFIDILRAMGVDLEEKIEMQGRSLHVSSRLTATLAPIEWDLKEAPDLFPVLSVLCALANGRSRLFGAPHLAHKESNRIIKSAELVEMVGGVARVIAGGLEIDGSMQKRSLSGETSPRASSQSNEDNIFSLINKKSFSTDHDHRLAMAAAVACAAGAPIEILEPQVVNKSFPEFWNIARLAGVKA